MFVGPRAEKFDIVSNDHGFTQKCDFSVLDQKYSLWANFVQKFIIVKLSQNLVHRVIQICRIQWTISIFCFDWKKRFWANLVPKFQVVCLKWNLVPIFLLICRIQWWFSIFLFLTRKTIFRKIWSKKSKFQNFRLIRIYRIQWWLFAFLAGNTLFWQIWSKKSKWSV